MPFGRYQYINMRVQLCPGELFEYSNNRKLKRQSHRAYDHVTT